MSLSHAVFVRSKVPRRLVLPLLVVSPDGHDAPITRVNAIFNFNNCYQQRPVSPCQYGLDGKLHCTILIDIDPPDRQRTFS
jgi:hypothetical protein